MLYLYGETEKCRHSWALAITLSGVAAEALLCAFDIKRKPNIMSKARLRRVNVPAVTEGMYLIISYIAVARYRLY